MATSPSEVVPATSKDTAGITVVTSQPSPTDARAGQAWSPDLVAAAQPVWFHPLKDGRYIMAMSRYWTAGTPDGGAGMYSAFTEVTTPSWVIVNGATGATEQVAGSLSIPMNTSVSSATLTAGASRPTDYLWLLHSVQISSARQAVMQYWDISLGSAVTLAGEEVLPTTPTVVFDKGIQYATPFIYVYGTDSAGKLYRIRKAWGRIGFNKLPPTGIATPYQGASWEYYTGTGYSLDPTELAPVQTDLTSAGPVSFGYYRTQVVMSTVKATGATRAAAFWTSNAGRTWIATGTTAALGSTSDSSYLGGCAQMQNQLNATPTELASSTNAAVPYVTTVKGTSGGSAALVNNWAMYSIALVG